MTRERLAAALRRAFPGMNWHHENILDGVDQVWEEIRPAMNTARLAEALNTISMGFAEAAEALTEQPGPVAASPSASSPLAATPAGSPVPADTPHPRVEASPFEDESVTWEPPDTLPVQLSEKDRILAECPVHFTPWKVKEAGISKNGKPYPAFWKCDGKNADGTFCTKRPDAAWSKSHDPERALATA